MNNTEPNNTPQPVRKNCTRWKIVAITLTTIFGLILIAGGLSAHYGPPGKHGAAVFSERFVDRMLDKVDASDEQITQTKAVIDHYKPSLQNIRGSKGDLRKEIAVLLQAPTIDRDALASLREQHLSNMEKHSTIFINMTADIAEILTQEQRKSLVDKMEKRFSRWNKDKPSS